MTNIIIQSDSGGPLLWHTDDEDRLYLIGIISSGYGCAENSAGINTRVTTYLQWIMANTIGKKRTLLQ